MSSSSRRRVAPVAVGQHDVGQHDEMLDTGTPTAAAPTPARPRRRAAGSWTVIKALFWKCGDDRVLGLAAEIAFFAVVSIFPALLMIAAALGSLSFLLGADTAETVERDVLRFLELLLTDRGEGAVLTVRQLFEKQQGDVLTVAFIAAVVTVSGAFAAVISALNIAYHAKETRNWIKRRLLGIALAAGSTVLGAFVLSLVVVGPLFGGGQELADRWGVGAAYGFGRDFLRWPLLFAGLVVWATTLCHFAPSRRSRWRRHLVGGTLAAVLWLAASVAFNVYLEQVAGRNPILGALGGGLILMAWLYLMSVALVIGGELNALLVMRDAGRLDEPAGNSPTA